MAQFSPESLGECFAFQFQGRCFLFEEGDADRIPGGNSTASKSLQKNFMNGVLEAAELFALYNKEKREREEANANKVSLNCFEKNHNF